MNRTTMVFAGLGFELFAVIVGAIILGPTVDKFMNWDGAGFLVIGGLLFVGWVTHFIYLIQRYMNDEMKTDEHRDN